MRETKRQKIEALLKGNISPWDIAVQLGCSLGYVQAIAGNRVRSPETQNVERCTMRISPWFIDEHGNLSRLIEGVTA